MRTRIVAIGMLLLLSAALTAAMQNGNDLYQQGLARETAGDIKGAMQIFERIVRDFSSNRALTARALLQLGRWSELLGEGQARKYYERVVREFAGQTDQSDVVAQAKSRLEAIAPTSAAITVQRLPDLSRDAELLAVSPDGTKAILMDYRDAKDNLALYDFATTQKRLLTDSDVLIGYTDFAVWSPDSRRVAYMQAARTRDASELRVMTLDGRSTLVYRTEDGLVRPVGWTPDGATLLVVLSRPDKTVAVGTLPATGGRFTPLRSFTWSANRGDGFRLSPNGRFVVYEEGEPGLRDIYVISLDGREGYRITDHPGDDFGPIWSPDSRHLAFTSGRSGTLSLWTVEVKEGKAVEQPVKLMDGMQSARLIDWIGRGIFFGQTANTSDLYTVTMDPVEGRATDMPRQIPYSRTGRNISPVWSPDGERLAFVSSSATEPNRRYVVVMTADGEQTREFLIPTSSYQNPASPYDLRWFGNGRGLGFSGFDTRGGKAVFRMSLETGEWDVVPLQVKASWTRTEWNRDGTAFYFARHSGAEANAGIFERSVNGGAERLVYRLAEPESNIRSLQFSPDRKLLAFQQSTSIAINTSPGPVKSVSSWGSLVRIMIVDVGTGEARTVLEATTDSSDLNRTVNLVSWSPSGDLLVWRPGTGGAPAETLLVPVNGGAPRGISIPSVAPGAPRAAPRVMVAKWSGNSIVFVRESRSDRTFVIENPLAAVSR